MTSADWLRLIFSGITGALVSAAVSAFIFGFLSWHREQRKRAIDLLEKFLTSEPLLKARLTAQAYLIPGVDRDKFARFHGKDFDAINETLERGSEEEQQDRIYLRAIPSFFWLVDEAMRSGVIPRSPAYWSRTYSYYWVMVIEPRRGNSNDPFYQCFEWMLRPEDLAERRAEYNDRLAKVAVQRAA